MNKKCKYCEVSLAETPHKSVCFDCKTARRRANALKFAKNRHGTEGMLKRMVRKIKKAKKRIAVIVKKEDTEARAMQMMELRFEGKKTLEQIGTVFGISRERVRQIIAKRTPDGGSGFVRKESSELTCKECGSKFLLEPSKSKIFCTTECRHKTLAKRRLEALKHCIMCNGTRHLVVVKTNKGVPYQARCTECSTERAKRYRHATKERMRASYVRAKRSYYKNREHSKVPQQFMYFKRQYGIKPPDNCPGCGEAKKLLAHHVDYSKPLLVAWLCHRCHTKVHNGNIEVPKEHLCDYSYLRRRPFYPRGGPRKPKGV